MPNDEVIQDVLRKIEREKVLINAATAMRGSTNNSAVQSQADEQIREAKRHIKYFEETLARLRMQDGMHDMSLSSNGRPGSGPDSARGSMNGYMSNDQYGGGYGGMNSTYPTNAPGGQGYMPPRPPFNTPSQGIPSPKGRPNYSRLDLIKYDTPHLGPRIQLMLSQLEFKLSVEKQYKDGIEKIMGAYKMDGDKKSRADAEGKRVESLQKIQLLQRALKHYEDLHVDTDVLTDPTDDDSLNAPSLRKPLTGHLTVRVHAVSDVTHASTGRYSRGPETYVIMKVEDDFKGRTKSTRNDRWTDESHEMDIDKGNEIELTVYDRGSGTHPTPIGMLWIRMADIAEEMRRKKIEMDINNAGWVSADKMADGQPLRPDLQFSPPPNSQKYNSSNSQSGYQGSNTQQPHTQPVAIESWFSLEPVGRIQLTLSFVKQTRERKVFDAGLNRKGAIRQRKEEVHELYGHKFVAQQFYNIMRCALCEELLKYAVGMQCSDCKYMCHEKCYREVVTKCISKSNSESDPDEVKLKHKIPHRFEVYGNMGANWCCHCGYILPLGRKNCRRCKECKLTAHASCTHLVPDFCGLPMKRANEMLKYIEPNPTRPAMQDMSLRPPKPAQPISRPSYNTRPTQEQITVANRNSNQPENYGGTSLGAAMQAFRSSDQPPSQRSSVSAQRPSQPVRSETTQSVSAQAAAAAAAAISGRRNPSQTSPPQLYKSQSDYTGRGSLSGPSGSNGPPAPNMHQYNPQAYAAVDNPTYGSAPQLPMITTLPSLTAPGPTPPAKPPANYPTQVAVDRTKAAAAPPRQNSGKTRVGLDHFNFLAVLGKGNFGKVMLAETKSAKKLYAIKVLKKEFIIENDEVESTKSEKEVFLIANKERHPFLLNLHACFQTETRVYFVMEYISGGDLMLHIQRGQFGTKRAQFYAAEVCLALKYFHENGVVYRDLKLDNIMLTLDGHIKVADYGLCKKDMWYGNTTSTFCGTPEFMAPEILLDKKYGRAVDWWAFGVLIYQMLLQQSPFRGEDEDEIYDAILADEPLYPIHMPRDSVSILQKLLTREPELRLGSGITDAQEIMSHAFFRNINWDDVYCKRMPAPFLPTIKNPTDTSNFDSEFTSVTPVLTPVQSVLEPAMQEEFRGFSYSADFF